jgi:hypothetical protein
MIMASPNMYLTTQSVKRFSKQKQIVNAKPRWPPGGHIGFVIIII